jgi:hypothetical protein
MDGRMDGWMDGCGEGARERARERGLGGLREGDFRPHPLTWSRCRRYGIRESERTKGSRNTMPRIRDSIAILSDYKLEHSFGLAL